MRTFDMLGPIYIYTYIYWRNPGFRASLTYIQKLSKPILGDLQLNFRYHTLCTGGLYLEALILDSDALPLAICFKRWQCDDCNLSLSRNVFIKSLRVKEKMRFGIHRFDSKMTRAKSPAHQCIGSHLHCTQQLQLQVTVVFTNDFLLGCSPMSFQYLKSQNIVDLSKLIGVASSPNLIGTSVGVSCAFRDPPRRAWIKFTNVVTIHRLRQWKGVRNSALRLMLLTYQQPPALLTVCATQTMSAQTAVCIADVLLGWYSRYPS